MKYLDLAIANEQIQTTDIKGKEYAEVNQRIKAFRMVYPQGFIIPHLTSNENGMCVFTAEVGYYVEHNTIAEDKYGKKYQDTYLEKVILGVGTAYEKEDSTFINKTSYIENCETSAVGRALGMAGFGIDVSVASAEEVANAMQNQTITKLEADSYVLPFGKYKGKTIKEVDSKYIDWLIDNTKDERILKIIELATGRKIPTEEETQQRIELMSKLNDLVIDLDVDYEELLKHYGVETNTEMTIKQLKEAVETLEKRKENE